MQLPPFQPAVLGIFHSLEKKAPSERGKGHCVFQGALTSVGFTGFLPPDDEQPTSFHNCLLPALANDQIHVIKRLFR